MQSYGVFCDDPTLIRVTLAVAADSKVSVLRFERFCSNDGGDAAWEDVRSLYSPTLRPPKRPVSAKPCVRKILWRLAGL